MTGNDIETFELDPETAAALQRHHDIDYAEADPTAPVSGFTYGGVSIESQWAVLAELETMKRIVDAMPKLMARRLAVLGCDSNCGANYVITVRKGALGSGFGALISEALRSRGGGHSGVAIALVLGCMDKVARARKI